MIEKGQILNPNGRPKLGKISRPGDNKGDKREDNLPNAMAFLNRRKGTWPKYTYIDNVLYRKISYNRGQDLITLWRVRDAQYVTFPYVETKKRLEPAFYTNEVAAMLNRHRVTIADAMSIGAIERPERGWNMNIPVSERRVKGSTGSLLWSTHDVMRAHEYFTNQRSGFKGPVVRRAAKEVPNRREVLAMMRQQTVTYTKTKDGEYIPLWKAPDF